ncbi:MAG: hypothetical protein Nk1A_7100 [Endomicrobiia bacterium]|nr:MAG: hypothetical protein Nk1A_7100 [Endomicrobiia bacterium]
MEEIKKVSENEWATTVAEIKAEQATGLEVNMEYEIYRTAEEAMKSQKFYTHAETSEALKHTFYSQTALIITDIVQLAKSLHPGIKLIVENHENIKLLEKSEKIHTLPKPLILVFDNLDLKVALKNILNDLNVPFIEANYDAVKRNGDISKSIGQLIKQAFEYKEIKEEIEEMSCLSDLNKRLKDMERNAKASTIDTGFKDFNDVLGGGLKGGRLYVIGAISSLGKTTFVLQTVDNVAKNGHPVLFFSLEMSKSELISKSLSRESFEFCKKNSKDYKFTKTASEIFEKSNEFTEQQIEVFSKAREEYAKYADNIYISEGIGDIGVKRIRETIDDFILCKKANPVVVVDYMQILSSYNDRFSDKQNMDKNITELKRICRDYNIPVIAISSFNRDNYLNEVSFESFKESGGIEYSVDVLIGLQLKINRTNCTDNNAKINEKREEINRAKNRYPREVELVILKNRMYKAWSKVDFNYYPKNDFFKCMGVVAEN